MGAAGLIERETMKTVVHWLQGALVASALLLSAPAIAQQSATPSAGGGAAPQGAAGLPAGFWITTPYPEFSLPLGEEGSIAITLRNIGLPPQRAEIQVSGLPEGWSIDLLGAGKEVSAAMVGPDETRDLTLNVTPPESAGPGEYPFEVRAVYGAETSTLPLLVRLSDEAGGGVTLTPELPALKGSPKSTFQFRVKVANKSAEDALFNLAVNAPQGLQVAFKRGYGSEEITGVPVAAGATETVTVEVKPMTGLPAGRYPLQFAALAGDLSAQADLSVEVTGTPDIQLIGPQERLSGETTAGQSTTFPFTLQSTGTAPAQNVQLSATPPSGWTVKFEPEQVPVLEAGKVQEVAVTITPSEKAIAGDYMVNLRASGDGISESAQFRATVNTSTVWGVAGLGVIGIAAIVLVLAVMRYGRR